MTFTRKSYKKTKVFVNRHIRGLIAKYDGVEPIDFSLIGRHLFIFNGMDVILSGNTTGKSRLGKSPPDL